MKIEVLQPMKYKNEANTTMNICYTDIYDMEELDNRRLYINNDINFIHSIKVCNPNI